MRRCAGDRGCRPAGTYFDQTAGRIRRRTSSSARPSDSASRSAMAARTPRFLATRDEHKRRMPGRFVGVSRDAEGRLALRLGAANTRTTHSPRKSDQQHLHGSGAARGRWRRCMRSITVRRDCKSIAAEDPSDDLSGLAGALKEQDWAVHPGPFFDTIRVWLARRSSGSPPRARRLPMASTFARSTIMPSASRSTTRCRTFRSLLPVFDLDPGAPSTSSRSEVIGSGL